MTEHSPAPRVEQPWTDIPRSRPADVEGMKRAIAEFLSAAGFDGDTAGHIGQTPDRVAETWLRDLLEGYERSPYDALGEPFDELSHEMVLVRDVELFSSCPHHLMPYRGVAHVAYVPAGRAVGFSGIVRLVDCLAHRLTLQEWLTRNITAVIDSALEPQGSACVIQAAPMCVIARGVRRPCTIMSSSFTGIFRTDETLRRAVLDAAGHEATL